MGEPAIHRRTEESVARAPPTSNTPAKEICTLCEFREREGMGGDYFEKRHPRWDDRHPGIPDRRENCLPNLVLDMRWSQERSYFIPGETLSRDTASAESRGRQPLRNFEGVLVRLPMYRVHRGPPIGPRSYQPIPDVRRFAQSPTTESTYGLTNSAENRWKLRDSNWEHGDHAKRRAPRNDAYQHKRRVPEPPSGQDNASTTTAGCRDFAP